MLILICVQKRREQEREGFFFFPREGRCPRRALLHASRGKTAGLAAKCGAATPRSDATHCSEEQSDQKKKKSPSAESNERFETSALATERLAGFRGNMGKAFQVLLCNVKEGKTRVATPMCLYIIIRSANSSEMGSRATLAVLSGSVFSVLSTPTQPCQSKLLKTDDVAIIKCQVSHGIWVRN